MTKTEIVHFLFASESYLIAELGIFRTVYDNRLRPVVRYHSTAHW